MGQERHQEFCAQLLPLLETLAATQDTLVAAQGAVQSGIAELCASAPDTINRFRATVEEVIAGVYAHRDCTILEFVTVCAERTKVLQAQADELEVSMGQLSTCIAQGHAAIAQTIPLSVHQALEVARSMVVLDQTDFRLRVPAQLDILVFPEPLLKAVAKLSKLCLYQVDACKTVVSGDGLTSFGIRVPNVFSVTCRDSDGSPAFWVTGTDVVLRVLSVGGGLAGHMESLVVTDSGVIDLGYVVDDEGVDAVELRLRVCGVEVAGGPWLVRAALPVPAWPRIE